MADESPELTPEVFEARADLCVQLTHRFIELSREVYRPDIRDSPITHRLGLVDFDLLRFLGLCVYVMRQSRNMGHRPSHLFLAQIEVVSVSWARYSRMYDEMCAGRLRDVADTDSWVAEFGSEILPALMRERLPGCFSSRLVTLQDATVQRIVRGIVQQYLGAEAADRMGIDNLPTGPRSSQGSETCLICQQPLEETQGVPLEWCRIQCGYAFHSQCVIEWFTTPHSAHSAPRCPHCRQLWLAPMIGLLGSVWREDLALALFILSLSSIE
ncbi:RING finger protein [Aspergillus brunneoviolaceus CBS 621.78]|uniref:Uncharacterized protein n=1 Tax=Aspergillus brunneoviolaceus CBS 621.78 TaxID=1450534 RepID=A0ACD1G827_9EURO|nr:hypothetical protein BO95DRAFT_432325 [Aspergillus brunneoviolaceus CBS 621.78]RAH45370.1 hypothetical protein BO95DRAFT_432325 [Aspergillus brunneoviolaceus CBS 621.78]